MGTAAGEGARESQDLVRTSPPGRPVGEPRGSAIPASGAPRGIARGAPRDERAGSRQTRGSLRQDIFRLAEREADEMASELAAREEGRAGHAGDADLADEPVRELGVVVEAEGRDVAEHVVRA